MVSLTDYFNVSLDYPTGRTDDPDNHNFKNKKIKIFVNVVAAIEINNYIEIS